MKGCDCLKELICTVCPKGCHLKVDDNFNVTGNSCSRAIDYSYKEITNPTRVLTSTVKIKNAVHCRLPVKTDRDIPKAKIKDIMNIIDSITVNSPIKCGDKIFENVLNMGVNIVATKSM